MVCVHPVRERILRRCRSERHRGRPTPSCRFCACSGGAALDRARGARGAGRHAPDRLHDRPQAHADHGREGLVSATRSSARTFYEARLAREETQAQLLGDLLDRAFEGSAPPRHAGASSKRASAEELEQIRAVAGRTGGGRVMSLTEMNFAQNFVENWVGAAPLRLAGGARRLVLAARSPPCAAPRPRRATRAGAAALAAMLARAR